MTPILVAIAGLILWRGVVLFLRVRAVRREWRRIERENNLLCPTCGYNIRGNLHNFCCPECGQSFEAFARAKGLARGK